MLEECLWWFSPAIYGYLWLSITQPCFFDIRLSMAIYGYLWLSMAIYGYLWLSMGYLLAIYGLSIGYLSAIYWLSIGYLLAIWLDFAAFLSMFILS